ncbi:serine/threonine-protein kinase Nek8 isoform X9 [Loxodonta africana]|uniref:serine/threonine-protein kinase Nek8 isoform X9 n=1 Tax=Loxodonta africana TaxID=9785 RepID=UPI000C8141A3|nr:serine/threonine-protein kinase Nek8 isoform X9 [Loxodonta africana]
MWRGSGSVALKNEMEKYERIRVVGRGAFGIVHLCLRKADQKLVIIKQIPVEQMTKEERQAAQNECQVLKLLNHPNVIEYYENFLEDKALMIAMEYAPGGTLAEFIQKRCNSLLEEETILHFFVQILLALHHVHTHLILHRDLKTQNILLDKHRMVVKIGDFGISKILSSKSKAYTVPGHGGDLGSAEGLGGQGPHCIPTSSLLPPPKDLGPWLGSLAEGSTLALACFGKKLPTNGPVCRAPGPISSTPRAVILAFLVQVVGTPCYISPELCEGKPYNQKSDIWALGCVLYELASLKRAFEAANLPALVLKIMSGTFAPISDRYSPELRQLVLSLLSLEPAQRPPLSHIMAQPLCIRALLNLHTDVGSVRMRRVEKSLTTGPPMAPGSAGGRTTSTRCRDRGIIMTFGSGSSGCLGHGSLTDMSQPPLALQPTIVEALLGYEMVQVACGASHVLALSTERELFAWGRGDGGRLGLGTRESHSCPQQVPMPPGQEAQRVVCGIDSSMVLTVPGRALACGSNRFNKLGLDHLSLGEEPAPHQQVEEALSFIPLGSAPLDLEPLLSLDLGTAHSAAVTASGDCYTFGSNQHGQLGTNARRSSRAPCQVQGLQGIKVATVACGDAFTVAIGAEGEVYSWGKGARGRLGRRDEDAGLPRPVQLDETHPYTVTSVSCCHGNTLLAVRSVTDEPVPP